MILKSSDSVVFSIHNNLCCFILIVDIYYTFTFLAKLWSITTKSELKFITMDISHTKRNSIKPFSFLIVDDYSSMPSICSISIFNC